MTGALHHAGVDVRLLERMTLWVADALQLDTDIVDMRALSCCTSSRPAPTSTRYDTMRYEMLF